MPNVAWTGNISKVDMPLAKHVIKQLPAVLRCRVSISHIAHATPAPVIGVLERAHYAHMRCLVDVEIKVKRVGAQAFYNCNALKRVALPPGPKKHSNRLSPRPATAGERGGVKVATLGLPPELILIILDFHREMFWRYTGRLRRTGQRAHRQWVSRYQRRMLFSQEGV